MGFASKAGDSAAPDFTIVIPTCNRPHLLPRALESARRQAVSHEIVVVDDASTPAVELDAQNGLTLIRSPRSLGAAGARNLGAKAARGKWLAFLDDDDEWDVRFLESVRLCLRDNPAARFCWSGIRAVRYRLNGEIAAEQDFPLPQSFESEDELLAAASQLGAGSGLAVERQTFLAVGGFDDNVETIEDTEFVFRLLEAGHRPAVVSAPLVKVHNHTGDRLTRASSYRQRVKECIALRERHSDLLSRYPVLRARTDETIEQYTRFVDRLEEAD